MIIKFTKALSMEDCLESIEDPDSGGMNLYDTIEEVIKEIELYKYNKRVWKFFKLEIEEILDVKL